MSPGAQHSESNPVVTISDGMLRGRRAQTRSGTQYYTFKGIPYARPPLGELRFRPPQPPEHWEGIRDATFERSISLQPRILREYPIPSSLSELWAFLRALPQMLRFLQGMSKQSEDCLYLNVSTPELPRTDAGSASHSHPVLFWIHGGGFLAGTGNEVFNSMDQMLDNGIVVVTFNYRLGPYGFLSLDTPSAPGNAGLKDQVQALHWVRRNVSQFGGDPERVTVYGSSAGGASAHLLTLSPLTKGLFHGAIASSGAALCDWSMTTQHVSRAKQFARSLNIHSEDPEEIAAALRKLSAEQLLGAIPKHNVDDWKTITVNLFFTPCVERPAPGAFLAELPESVLRAGRQHAVPFITGMNAHEGSLWYMIVPGTTMDHVRSLVPRLMPEDLYDALSEEQRVEVAKQIVEFYCGERGVCSDTEQEFVQLFGDVTFAVAFLRTCCLHAATGRAPLYMYHFTFDGQLGTCKKLLKSRPVRGPGHGDELGYIAPVHVWPEPWLGPQDPETRVRSGITSLFTSFIRTGTPTLSSEMNADVLWNPISNNCTNYLEMGEEFQIKQDKFGPRFQFWDELYKKYLNKPILISKENSHS